MGLAAGPVRAVRQRDGAVGDTSKGVSLEGDCSSYQVRFSVLRLEGFPSGFQPYFKRFINGNKKYKSVTYLNRFKKGMILTDGVGGV